MSGTAMFAALSASPIWAEFSSTFKELAAYANELGVFVGMEGAAGHVCWNVATLKRAIDKINAPNIIF